MKRLKRITAAVSALALCAILAPVAYAYGNNGSSGSLQITPSSDGVRAAYDAYRIADSAGLPLDDQMNWPGLSGVSLDGRAPYPSYIPDAETAASDGRALVERVSADLLSDDAGVLAQALAGFLVKNARPAAHIVAGAGAVSVDDGWYLLVSPGRRPLFAWVEGAAVELGDKSDTPVLCMQVDTGSGWADHAVAGSGRVIDCRIDVSVPSSIEAGAVYPLCVRNTWDERLSIDKASISVSLLYQGTAGRSNDTSIATAVAGDVTASVDIGVDDNSLQVHVDDLRKLHAAPGNVLRISYRMNLKPDEPIDSKGISNGAYAEFSSWKGEDKTPSDEARVYAMRVRVKKADESGAPLAGAVIALRNDKGWLTVDGSFGDKNKRLEVVTGGDGAALFNPLLADGTYEVVEVVAPKGYLPLVDGASFELEAEPTQGSLRMSARATSPLRVASVDARKSVVSFELVNKKEDDSGLLGGFIPQTGDTPWLIGCVILAFTGVIAVLGGTARNRSH